MILTLSVSEVVFDRIEAGDQKMHMVDNSTLNVQRGDRVDFQVGRYGKVDTVSVGVTFVTNVNQAPNWVAFTFTLLTSESALMGWSFTNKSKDALKTFPEWQLQKFATEEDYKRSQELRELIGREKRGKDTPAKRRRLESFLQELNEIDSRKGGGVTNGL